MDAGVTPDVIVEELTNETASGGAPAAKCSPHMRALWSTPIFESLLLVGPGSSIDRMRLLSFTEAELLSRRISTANLTSGRTNVRNQYPKFGLGGVPKRAAPIWRTERVAQGLLR
jgi:hypothetical protein